MTTLKQDLSKQDARIRAKIKETKKKLDQAPTNEKSAFQKTINELFDERDELISLKSEFAVIELKQAASPIAKAAIDLRRNALGKIMKSLSDTLKSIRENQAPPPVVVVPTPPPPQEPEIPAVPSPLPATTSRPDNFDGPHIIVTEEDINALAHVALSEIEIFGNYGKDQLEGGTAAVIDTILNRVCHPRSEFPKSIQAVIDKPAQFSAINKLGTWKKLRKPTNAFRKMVENHVKARTSGSPSKIMGATHFLNPNTSSETALTKWGNHVVANKTAWYGKWGGKYIHYHGFAPGYTAPPSYAVEYKGKISYFTGTGLPVTLPVPNTIVVGDLLPQDWTPNANMKRIITHWTAGSHTASGLDRHHYHILVETDGNIIRGQFSIKANEKNLKNGHYAAHTLGTNTGSIGIAVCCMAGAKESPFKAGNAPMTKIQWEQLIRITAELCRSYSIPVAPDTVLGHGEVQANLGNQQKGKWDPLILPWDTSLSKQKVGNMFRAEVAKLLN